MGSRLVKQTWRYNPKNPELKKNKNKTNWAVKSIGNLEYIFIDK